MRPSRSAHRNIRATGGALALALALGAIAGTAAAALPRPVGRAFLDAGIPLNAVALVVRDLADSRPLFAHQPDRPYNPASVMKLVTTFAALELLGPDYRWKTFAYLDGPLDAGVLRGNLVLKGGGDPKITIERWRIHGCAARRGARRRRRRPRARPLALRADRPQCERVRRRAAEALQRRTRRAAGQFQGGEVRLCAGCRSDASTLTVEPALPAVSVGAPPKLAAGDCGDWRSAIGATFVDSGAHAEVALLPDAIQPPAVSASGGCRCSTTRPTCTGCSTRIFAPRADALPAAGRKASRRQAPFRSRRSNPRRCGRSSATSTRARTTSWRGSSS